MKTVDTIFYCPDIRNSTAILPAEEAGHALKALRLGVEDEIIVVDGKGGTYQGTLIQADKKGCAAQVRQLSVSAPVSTVHLAIAPTKNIDRIEWLVEKAVEVGVSEISFLRCQRSERKEVRLDRLERIAISAMKQSGKTWLPKLNPIDSFNAVLSRIDKKSAMGIAHCNDGEKVNVAEWSAKAEGKGKVVFIGPEGDFSPEEVAAAIKAGFQPISLGTQRLRTETAGLVALVFCGIG